MTGTIAEYLVVFFLGVTVGEAFFLTLLKRYMEMKKDGL